MFQFTAERDTQPHVFGVQDDRDEVRPPPPPEGEVPLSRNC